MGSSKILAAAFVLVFLMTGASCAVSAENTDGSSVSVPLDAEFGTSAALPNTLYFSNPAVSADSVKKINELAGTVVCNYTDDCLMFTASVHIYLASSNSMKGVFVFDNGSTQAIGAADGVTVRIQYYGTSAPSNIIGAVNKTGSGDLNFTGSGELQIVTAVSKTYGVVCSKNVYFKGNTDISTNSGSSEHGKTGLRCGNVYFEENSKTSIYGYTDGIEMTGSEISFRKCSAGICGKSSYGINCVNIQKATYESCKVYIESQSGAFSKCAKSNTSILCSFSVSGNTGKGWYDDEMGPDATDVADFRIVSISTITGIGGVSVTFIFIGAAVFVFLIVFATYLLRSRRKTRYGSSGIFGRNKGRLPDVTLTYGDEEVRYRPTDQSNTIHAQSRSSDYVNNTASVKRTPTEYVPPEIKTIDVGVQSLVEGESFVIILNDKVIGYIRTDESSIRIEPGTYNMAIRSNNAHRRDIYKKVVRIRPGMKIVVSKNIRGYEVEFQQL